MYPFTQSVNPAVRLHIDAQMAFFNELSESISRSFQKGVQLNMQLGQTLLAEAANTGQRMLAATGRPADPLSAEASQTQSAADQLRAYQQQLSQLVADAQVDLSRVSERHVQETSRTARALADNVTRATVEETDKGLRRQEEAAERSRDAFKQEGERIIKTGAPHQGNVQSSASGAGGKPDGQLSPSTVPGNMQADNKIPSSPR